ncbi:hypothetical protein G6L37_06530 [Agrobacterium rubi]|nr:hypothetical protein [Agrobacterium rubi]NTF25019.1 hypothetical protein [Agrobacterium rubi]
MKHHITPRPRRMTRKNVMALGSERHSILNDCNGSLMLAASRMGGRVDIVAAPETLLVVNQDMSFVISGSALTSLKRDNLTYATAIGHYHLHAFDALQKPAENRGQQMVVPYEIGEADGDLLLARYEAYWFAFGFLMPVGAFEEALASRGIDETALAFGVAPSLVNLRVMMAA